MPSIQKQSCTACARRKVKCDRLIPCSKCSRGRTACIYETPAPSQRHRKRPPDEDLLSKVREYEDLLRKNNVRFQPLDNSWVPSILEEKLAPKPEMTRLAKASSKFEQHVGPQSSEEGNTSETQPAAVSLWFGLPKELRDCSEQLKRSGIEAEEGIEMNYDFSLMAPLLIPIRLIGGPTLLELHPAPKHIFKLWGAFAEKIDPLTKVIHTPTLQQRILDTSWSLETVLKPLEAIMFSVYALAVTSMKPVDCVNEFGERKLTLLNRYRSGAAQALAAAELHSTKELEVLQAYVLFLLQDPRSEISVTLVSIAMRIGHKMGLHRTGSDPHMSVFEEEMRIRVWWQIMAMESWSRRKVLGLTLSLADYGEVRMPMNVNDAELHPNMTTRPVEHLGTTEMLYCLMKYEIRHYIRSWLTVASVDTVSPHELLLPSGLGSISNKKTIVNELSQIYEEKYLRYCDLSIPLHRISATTSRLTIHRLRFWFYHPRNQPKWNPKMLLKDQDIVFESSIRLLQLDYDLLPTNFSTHLLQHQSLKQTEVDALVYMVSELQHRVSGDLVRTAWEIVERIYRAYPQLLRDDRKFYTSLADIVLKAWEAYTDEAKTCMETVSEFVGKLQDMRGDIGHDDVLLAASIGATMPDGGFPAWLIDDDPVDWIYWNELP